MAAKAESACFWLMSEGGIIDAVCVDIHDANGDLVNHKDNCGFCYVAPATSFADGLKQAIAYAATYGVADEDRIHYDPDSSLCFADGDLPAELAAMPDHAHQREAT
jgi:hypothetical protein